MCTGAFFALAPAGDEAKPIGMETPAKTMAPLAHIVNHFNLIFSPLTFSPAEQALG
jgi:hypothetical protein